VKVDLIVESARWLESYRIHIYCSSICFVSWGNTLEGRGGLDSSGSGQDRDQWRAVVNWVMDVRVA